MFKVLPLLLTASLILMPGAQAADTLFGERPALKNTVKISAILDAPEKYLGKVIQVEGIVMDVCPMRGCWMKVKSDRKKENLFIKVNDGEMVFPMSARGKNTVIKGQLVKQIMPLKDVIEIEKARAEKKGEKFDPASVKGPRTSYMFKPIGVVIKDK
jgi:hypothetical protein